MIKTIFHYLVLALTLFSALVYWGLTFGSGYLSNSVESGFREAPTGLDSVLLHPVFSYAILLVAVGLVVKEFYLTGLRSKFIINGIALMVVMLFMATLVNS